MNNDPESNVTEPRKKSALLAGLIASLLGTLVILLYIFYLFQLPNGPFVNGPLVGGPLANVQRLLMALMFFYGLSFAAGIWAFVRRRWTSGLVGIVLPVLLPLLDWLCRTGK